MMEISAIVTSAWTVLQPFLPVIATKAAEEIGKTSVVEVWTAIKKKFETKETAKEVLRDLLNNLQDEDAQGAFRLQLRKLLDADHEFADHLAQLLEKTENDYRGQVFGDGALAQGMGAKAVGAGGIMIEGNISGSDVVTGSDKTIQNDRKHK